MSLHTSDLIHIIDHSANHNPNNVDDPRDDQEKEDFYFVLLLPEKVTEAEDEDVVFWLHKGCWKRKDHTSEEGVFDVVFERSVKVIHNGLIIKKLIKCL